MALTKIMFKPGINKENTNYATEGGYYNCDKVRFRSGTPEKIGGWVNQLSSGSTFAGIARSMWNWSTYDGINLLAIGTNQEYYVADSSIYHNITPVRTTVTLANNPITSVNGSFIFTIVATAHGATATTYISISGATAVGGVTLSGIYEIITVPDPNTYTVRANAAAASSATGGGAAVVVVYKINSGTNSTITAGGYGAGPYGGNGYGIGLGGVINHPIQLWSQNITGQDLIFAPRGGLIYYWLKDTATWNVGVTLNSYSNTIVATTKAATFGGGVSTITVPDDLSLYPGCVISGTNITAGTYITTAYAGGTSVPISVVTGGASSGNYTFSYSGQSVPTQTNYITTTDINGFVVALGANPYDPTNLSSTFDPMLVRWSDQNNPYQWVPDTNNQSGELHLTNGSYLIAANNTRQEQLIWSDTALYSMQYVGPPFIFNFQMIMDHISLISQNAIVSVNNVTYWMGKDKFYTYTGQVNTLQCDLRQFVFEDINLAQSDQVVSGSNPGFNEVWWFYPSMSGAVGGSNVNDRYVIYNYVDNIWYYGNMNRTGWLYSALKTYPLGIFSKQTSYLNANIGSTDAQITLLDGTSYPANGTITIDSEQITYTGIFGSSLLNCSRGANNTVATSHTIYTPVIYSIPNQVLFHEYGVDDQSLGFPVAMPSYLESADFDIGDGDHFAFVWRIVPDLSFDGSTVTNPQVMLTVKSRPNPGSNYTPGVDTPLVTRTSTFPIEQFTGQVYTRVRSRQLAFRIDSSGQGVQWQSGAMRIDLRPDGRR